VVREAEWLNALGAEGWELVTINRIPRDADNIGWKSAWGEALLFAIYKRRVANGACGSNSDDATKNGLSLLLSLIVVQALTCYAILWVANHAPDGWLALAFVPPVFRSSAACCGLVR